MDQTCSMAIVDVDEIDLLFLHQASQAPDQSQSSTRLREIARRIIERWLENGLGRMRRKLLGQSFVIGEEGEAVGRGEQFNQADDDLF